MNSEIARERIASVVKPDSITASQGDFLATHVSIKRLHLLNKFDLMPSGGTEYSEDDVYNRFVLNPENKHQFIAVYGQSGTGKSHLIRWFQARYQNDKPANEVVLFIRRSDNTLKGTIKQLLAMPEVQGIANKDIFDRLVQATVCEDENKLKGRIYHDFVNEVECDDESHEIQLTNVKRKRLVAFLNNEVVKTQLMSHVGPIERIYSKVAENSSVDRDTIAQFIPDDFIVTADLFEDIQRAGVDPKAEKMAKEFMADDSGPEDAKKIASYLNQFVNDVIQRCAGIEPGDFRDVFQDIRKELHRLGKTLTLFIEDVTSFTGVDDALLDALIVEHTGMNADENLCRISSIVGTTSNYLQNNFRDNHKDRITTFVYIPSDAFDEQGIFELVGRYINTMSLAEKDLNAWVTNHASKESYPVHTLKEGANWDNITIEAGKELCLYPFTKHCIRYLYRHVLTNGHQTPRYIIRDIIEPVVYDILNNRACFPSIKFNISNLDVNLSDLIHNQVNDENEAERLQRFLCIWGNGKPEQSTEDGVVFIAGIRKEILDELSLPSLAIHNSPPKPGPIKPEPPTPTPPPTTPTPTPPKDRSIRVENAVSELQKWTKGQPLDVSASVGTVGILRAAQDDMCKFLFTCINWTAEGVSIDNITKVKNSSVKLITFENQTKVNQQGFYVLPAIWESMRIVTAFVRWRELGSQSWRYDGAEADAYIVSSWALRIKDDIVKAVSEYSASGTSYIEAAIAAEIFRQILCGQYTEPSLEKLTAKNLFCSIPSDRTKLTHSKEWNALISLMKQKGADEINLQTAKQYFNIPQGQTIQANDPVLVLDEPNLTRAFLKVKDNDLSLPNEAFNVKDPVKLRRDVFEYLKAINDRLDSVAKAEKERAMLAIRRIHECYDTDDVEEDDILELASRVSAFYDTINDNQFSIRYCSAESVKSSAQKIAKAINEIETLMDEEDPLTIIMALSRDPVSDLKLLVDLFDTLEKDIAKLDVQLASRKAALGGTVSQKSNEDLFSSDLILLDKCLDMLEKETEL